MSTGSDKYIRCCTALRRKIALYAVLAMLFVVSGSAAVADDYYVDTDDYQENEEITGTFLEEEDYVLMIESLERNGVAFDWGWARTPGWGEAAPVAQEEQGRLKKAMGRLDRFRRRGPKTVQQPRQLAFDLRDYRTVFVAMPVNSVGVIDDSLLPAIGDTFARAMEELGLTSAEARDQADLDLGLALVDLNGFVELELRLRDQKTGKDLLLLRHQTHSSSHLDAVRRYANELIRFLS